MEQRQEGWVGQISPANSAASYKKALTPTLPQAGEENAEEGLRANATAPWTQSYYLVVKQGLQHGTG